MNKLSHTEPLLVSSKGFKQERGPSQDSGGYDTQLSKDMMQALKLFQVKYSYMWVFKWLEHHLGWLRNGTILTNIDPFSFSSEIGVFDNFFQNKNSSCYPSYGSHKSLNGICVCVLTKILLCLKALQL